MGELGKPRSIGITILLFIVTLGIYGFVWTYKTFDEMKRYSGNGVGGLIGLIIGIFVGVVNYFLIANEVENLYRGDNREPPVRTVTGFWFLLPLVGAIIWYVKVQGALNEFWQAHGAPAP
jgi:hypothetical protein